ncbi:MAG TPA: ABC transporter ATP-binding protein [Symbiobacteriaceae bacterium]|nr:ABC transporter ATP-binding protein [Symbiobacteriaceae bacterium]
MTMRAFVRRMIGQAPGLYAVWALCWLLFHAWPLVPGLLIRAFVDAAASGVLPVWPYALAALGLGAARAGVVLAAHLVGIPYRFRLQGLLQRDLLARVLSRPGARALPGTVGEAVSTLRDDVTTTLDGVDLTFDALAGLLYALGCVAILLGVDWQVTLLVFLPVLAVIILAERARGRLVQTRAASREAAASLTGAMGEIFAGVQAVRVAGAEGRAVAFLRRLSDARQAAVLRERRQGLMLEAVFANVASLGTGLVLLVVAGKLAAGRFSPGDLALFIWYLVDVAGFTGFLGYIMATWRQAGVSLSRLEALVPHTGAPSRLAAPAPLEQLEVSGLTYVHPETGRGIRNASFALERGSFTVITGRIGSGKTTLVRALMGLLEPQAGEVRWNGEPVADPGRFFTAPRAAYTAQVPTLLSGTLRENILLGFPADDAGVAQAVRSAVLDEDLAGFPRGLETEIGARGVKLSGGQVLRTAAARMFVRGAELLVFDDLSSALDAETERLLWERTRDTNATYLVVSNRPGALARADQVLHVEDGHTTPEVIRRRDLIR